jgi:hypothetical protein
MMIIIHGKPGEGMSYKGICIAQYIKNEKKTPTTKTSDVSIAP